jgi:Protein of unknown function (DUF3179)
MKKLLLAIGLLILFAAEILKVYFIMPFPGSQRANTIGIAYFLQEYSIYIRIIALLLIAYGLSGRFGKWRRWQQVLFVLFGLLYVGIFYVTNFKFLADKIFYQPRIKSFAGAAAYKDSADRLVIGVEMNGEAKAYPIEIIGYHHQVKDTVGGKPIMVTYCTVCRTGRVYSPFLDNKYEEFRLVGMDHFNAMFEDKTTKSWWRQVTGEAIAGPLKGKMLEEIPSLQMGLKSWLEKHPSSLVLQPDSNFKRAYKGLKGYDNGTIEGSLEKRDSASWQFKSWVIGVQYKNFSRAYDWNDLVQHKVINDSLPNQPLLIAIEPDTVSFHAWSRIINGQTLYFTKDSSNHYLQDAGTHSKWDFSGLCIEGPLKDQRLTPLHAYQEFWHSWRTFHPATEQYIWKKPS